MNEYDFTDETQLYYEWALDTFTDATRLVWELGGYDLQSGKDLDAQWKAIQPVLKEAFEKAKQFDRYCKLSWFDPETKLPKPFGKSVLDSLMEENQGSRGKAK